MGFGQWELKDGVWVSKNSHTTQAQPTDRSKSLLQGKAPFGLVRTGTTEQRKLDNLRRYDKPSEDQIKKLQREDEEETRKRLDVAPVVGEAKKDLESGKIRIHPGVLHNLNKKHYDKVVPFSSVQDGEITHIVPQDKTEQPEIKGKSPEELYAEMKKQFPTEERVTASIGMSQPGNLAPMVEERDLVEGAMQTVKGNRAKFRGRTII